MKVRRDNVDHTLLMWKIEDAVTIDDMNKLRVEVIADREMESLTAWQEKYWRLYNE